MKAKWLAQSSSAERILTHIFRLKILCVLFLGLSTLYFSMFSWDTFWTTSKDLFLIFFFFLVIWFVVCLFNQILSFSIFESLSPITWHLVGVH